MYTHYFNLAFSRYHVHPTSDDLPCSSILTSHSPSGLGEADRLCAQIAPLCLERGGVWYFKLWLGAWRHDLGTEAESHPMQLGVMWETHGNTMNNIMIRLKNDDNDDDTKNNVGITIINHPPNHHR